MENKLTVEELKGYLDCIACINEQAYNQLVEIVEEHELWEEIKIAEYERGLKDRQQNATPMVTREWIRNEIDAYWDITEFDDEERGKGALLYRLVSIFEKIGVEVVE